MSKHLSRRSFIRDVAGVPIVAAAAVALPALAAIPSAPDPIFAMIAEWRAEQKRLDELHTDENGNRYADLTNKLYRAVPTTISGLAALTAVFREEAEWNDDAELWLDTICAALGKLKPTEIADV
jgi:hypothetical protein